MVGQDRAGFSVLLPKAGTGEFTCPEAIILNSNGASTIGSASGTTIRGATYAFLATPAASFATASGSRSGTASVFATGSVAGTGSRSGYGSAYSPINSICYAISSTSTTCASVPFAFDGTGSTFALGATTETRPMGYGSTDG